MLAYESLYEQDPALFGLLAVVAVIIMVGLVVFSIMSCRALDRQMEMERKLVSGFYEDYGKFIIGKKGR